LAFGAQYLDLYLASDLSMHSATPIKFIIKKTPGKAKHEEKPTPPICAGLVIFPTCFLVNNERKKKTRRTGLLDFGVYSKFNGTSMF
jgi:hypothetical protein